ncbi:MAG: type secretion system protein VirD4, partial [Bacillota bacterium]|nr:type secretion system protein VirD4 [Bacillota bacterium]
MRALKWYVIAALALFGAAVLLEYPLLAVVAGVILLGWRWMPGRPWWLLLALPVLAGAGGYLLGEAICSIRGQVPASAGADAWLTLKKLALPDAWGRGGVLVGCGLAVAAAAGEKVRRSRVHDSAHVHGLRVADNAALGTRRWAGDADLAKVAEFGPPREGRFGGGTIVGKLKGRIVRLYPDKCKPPLPQHACVVAGTGAGKTYSFVIPNVIAAAMEGESLVLTDPKGELACLLAPWLREKGYKVYLFNLAYPQWSSCWNPVLECRDDEEITAFATAIVTNAATDRSGYFL